MPTMTGAQVMADMLKGYGLSHLFMVPAVLRRTMVELERRTGIKRLHVHSEKSAAYMADGYARATRRPGVCMAQVIGALNLAAGLRDAHLAHSPVIAMTGGRDPQTKFRGVYQEVDDLPAFEPVTKFNATVDAVERFPDMIRQAFRAATSGTPGPVHLQFRGNEGQIDAEHADMEAWCEPGFAQLPPFRPEPGDEEARAALALLEAAQRPVIVAGGGVRASGAAPELVALAECLNIPVATSLNGKDVIPGFHPLSVGVVGTYSRECANQVVNQADLVCFIGTTAGGMTTHFWQVPPPGVPAIHIDIEARIIGRNYPLQAAVQADAKAALTRMLALADSHSAPRRAAWVRARGRNRRRVARQVQRPAGIGRRPDAARTDLQGADRPPAGRCHRRRRHRARRHVDGRHVRSAHSGPELHAQRRPSGMGLPGGARGQVRGSRTAGILLYR